MELRKIYFLLAVLLEIIMSVLALSHNNTSAQTYDTIMRQREMFKNNPQIQIGSGGVNPQDLPLIVVNPRMNKIYVPNPYSNSVSVIDSNTGNVTNIRVGIYPTAIAFDFASDKIYVANTGSNTVSVINAVSDKKEANDIAVGIRPMFMYVHLPSNKIYVANTGSNTVSVINAVSDKKEANDIAVGIDPNTITGFRLFISGNRILGEDTGSFNLNVFQNTGGHIITIDKIYVANTGSNTVSVIAINASNDKEIRRRDVPVGGSPSSIIEATDLATANPKIYVANEDYSSLNGSDTLSVINGTNDKEISKIPVGSSAPVSIAYDLEANKIYVANTGSGTVSVINATNDKKITDIPVGVTGAISVMVASNNNKIYVTNLGSNTISVINTTNDKEISKIPVGRGPRAIAINTYGDANPSSLMIYVFNELWTGSNTVSVIDGSIDKVTTGVTFNIHPANSGSIWCNNKEYPSNIYLYVANGIKCIARPNKDFEFSGWSENLNHNSTIPLNQSAVYDSPLNSLLSTLGMKPTDTSATFNVNRFGAFTANFKPVPPSVPPQYWSLIITVIVTTVVGWSIPSIIGWIRARTRRKESIKEYDDIIESLSNATDRKSLHRINNRIIRAYISEKINEFQYKILDKKISEYYHNIDNSNFETGQSNKST